MNSPEISLDMNLDSPPIADGISGSGGGGEGMDRDENNTLAISAIAHQSHRKQSEENSHKENYDHNCDNIERSMNHSSFGSGVGSGSIKNIKHSSSNTSSRGESNKETVKKIDCDKMIKKFEEWKDELLMMRVQNAIVLDDLVKVGASV